MTVGHTIFLEIDESGKKRLASLGIVLDLEGKAKNRVHFLITEEHPNWREIQEAVIDLKGHIATHCSFTEADEDNARYLHILAREQDYPRPNNLHKFLAATYNDNYVCRECRIGYVQKAPFRFRKEPTWGRYSICSMYWVPDELFVKPEAWEAVFKQFGVGCRPVVRHRNGEELKTVVQLDIRDVMPLKLDWDKYSDCPDCGRRKYDLFNHDYMPNPEETDVPVFKTEQWFSGGGLSEQYIYIRQDVRQALVAAGIQGAAYRPCAPVVTG